MRTLPTCPHCGALIDRSTFCTICGKSPHEDVEPVEPDPSPSMWGQKLDRRRLLNSTTSVIGIIAVTALIWAWTHPPDETYVAQALPAPTPTDPPIRSDSTAPSVDTPAGLLVRPLAAPVGSERDASAGLAPWEEAPPVNLLTGKPLGAADFTLARERVAVLLGAVPEPWSTTEPRNSAAADGSVDLADVEATQPFAARGFAHRDFGEIGDLWIMAAAENDPAGAAYIAETRELVSHDDVLEVADTRPGIRLVRIAVDDIPMWYADVVSPSVLLLFFVGPDTDSQLLVAFVEDWQFAALQIA